MFADGKAAGKFPADLPSEDIGMHLPHLKAAVQCRFDFELEVLPTVERLDFTAVVAGIERTLFSYDLASVRRQGDRLKGLTGTVSGLSLPPPELVFLTQGHRDAEAYRDSIIPGLLHLERYLSLSGFEHSSVRAVLDFGCGTGRLLAGLYASEQNRDLFGCDVRAELVDWSQANLPTPIRVGQSLPVPPLPYPSGSFDLVLAISVLTHMGSAAQQLWAADLRRVLRPGGAMLVTFHGEPYVRLFMRERLDEFRTLGHLERGGTEGSNTFASFHTRSRVETLFGGLNLLGCFPSGSIDGSGVLFPLAAFQDVYVFGSAR